MFAKFFISGERKLGREIGRNFLQAGVGLCSKLSAKVLSCINGVACLKERILGVALLDFFLFFFDFDTE